MLHDGNSVAQVAVRAGISTDALIEWLNALARERLQALVGDGLVDSDELDEVLEEIVERIRKEIGKATPLIQKRFRDPDDDDDFVPTERPVVTPDRVPFDLKLVARILDLTEEALVNRLRQVGDHHIEIDEKPAAVYQEELLERIRDATDNRISLQAAFAQSSRTERVGLFLAMLELVRLRQIRVRQEELESEIIVELSDPE